jgi:hypothetical protein
MKLCSQYNPKTELVCDLEQGHKGPHEAKSVWGDRWAPRRKNDRNLNGLDLREYGPDAEYDIGGEG